VTITAAPGITFGPTATPVTAAGTTALLLAVDSLRITWGRSSVTEIPQAATAQVTVLDRSPRGAALAARTDLIGQGVYLTWAGSDGSGGRNFVGRITDVQARPMPGGAGAGFLVALAASSTELDLGNIAVPDGTTWPAETMGARASRVRGMLPGGGLAGGLVLPDRYALGMQSAAVPGADLDTYNAAAVDVSGKTVAELVRTLYASWSPLPVQYDPDHDGLTFCPRRRYAYGTWGWTASARAVTDPGHGGRWVPASLAGLHLDGGLLGYSGPLTQQLDNRLTRVEVGYTTGGVAATAAQSVTDVSEQFIGRRTWQVDSWHADAAPAAQLAGLYADVATREARAPRLGNLSWSSDREPLPDAAHARALLAGYDTGAAVFVGRSWLPQLAACPLLGLIGGTITYTAGAWQVDLSTSPVVIDPAPNAWAPITPAACAPTVRARDLDPSLTFGDAAYLDVGVGYTTATGLPYKGNPR
jgi:hypothetical protein